MTRDAPSARPEDEGGMRLLVTQAFVEQLWDKRHDTARIAELTSLSEADAERALNRMMDRKHEAAR